MERVGKGDERFTAFRPDLGLSESAVKGDHESSDFHTIFA